MQKCRNVETDGGGKQWDGDVGTKERISVETDAGEAVRKRRNVEMDASGQGSDLTFFRLLPSLRVGNYLPFGGRQRSPIRGSLHPQLLRKRSVAASPDLSAAKKEGEDSDSTDMNSGRKTTKHSCHFSTTSSLRPFKKWFS